MSRSSPDCWVHVTVVYSATKHRSGRHLYPSVVTPFQGSASLYAPWQVDYSSESPLANMLGNVLISVIETEALLFLKAMYVLGGESPIWQRWACYVAESIYQVGSSTIYGSWGSV